MSIPVLLISMLLFFILFFGIGFLLNMLLRQTWVMSMLYPIVCIFIINRIHITAYFQQPSSAFSSLLTHLSSLGQADLFILTSGMIGALASGFSMKALRNSGYRMF
ncbi:YuiB family protein [Ectobacillus polymachus]|uniref:YuiB family protein n=1 Tax=Ectobacillus polymachus TaxID=1508806 RepID=UPI003A867B4F